MAHMGSFALSSWAKRLPIMSLATCGLVVATALATYQLKLVAEVWDPIFGGVSSARVVTAPVLSWLPIPDALLGMLGYLADIFTEAWGDEARWRRTPWLALLTGVVITGMALVSVGLVALQALVVHAWCALCLVSALLSWVIFALGIREPVAALYYVGAQMRRGAPLMTVLRGTVATRQSGHFVSAGQ